MCWGSHGILGIVKNDKYTPRELQHGVFYYINVRGIYAYSGVRYRKRYFLRIFDTYCEQIEVKDATTPHLFS